MPGKTVTEVACFPNKALPERGLIERLPCKGDKQYERALANSFQYYLALNEEHVTDALFDNSVTELLRLGEEQNGLISHKKNELGQTEYLSILVAQLHRRSIHIEGFHLLGEPRVLVRTQSIVESNAKFIPNDIAAGALRRYFFFREGHGDWHRRFRAIVRLRGGHYGNCA